MTFIYEKLTNKLCSELDNDTLSIITQYSVFYTEKDYDLVFQKIEQKLNNILPDYSKFIYFNIFLLNLLNELDDILMEYHNVHVNYTLDEVFEHNKKHLMKRLNNETLVNNILNLYYEDNISFNCDYHLTFYDLMYNSREILISNLKLHLKFTNNDINQFLFYINDNLDTKYDLNTFFPKYKTNFVRFFNVEFN